jgi:hypothetical protein
VASGPNGPRLGQCYPSNTSPEAVWTAVYDADGRIRPGARRGSHRSTRPEELPTGMRVIVRREKPHPGAQLRITDANGRRVTAFATNTRPGGAGTQLPELERVS